MVFSTETIKYATNKSIFNNKQNIGDIDNKSFFIESLDLISQEQRVFKSLLNESFSREIIYEGVASDLLKSAIKRIDPKKIITNIFQGFLKLLETLWNKFHAFMLDYMGKNNVLKRYRNKLETINVSVYFPENRYMYTNLGTSTSYTTFKNELEKEYSSLVLNISKFRDFKTYENLFIEIENMKNQIDFSDEYFDSIRGNVVASSTPVKKEEFTNSLYEYFRNNGIAISEGYILPEEIRLACNQYFDYSKTIKQIQKDKSDLSNTAKDLQKKILSINLEEYIKDNIPSDAHAMFISVLKDKARRLNDICNIYLHVFSIKLDAVKESYSQYTKMLMTACKQIVKEGL